MVGSGKGMVVHYSPISHLNIFLVEFLSLKVSDKKGNIHLYFLLKERFPVLEIFTDHFEKHAGSKKHLLMCPLLRHQVMFTTSS